MNSFSGVFQRPAASAKSLLDFAPISEVQQNGLKRIYGLLSLGILTAGLGTYTHLYYFSLPVFLSAIVEFGSLGYIFATRQAAYYNTDKNVKNYRYAAFFLHTFVGGMLLGGLVQVALFVNPAILLTAFFGTLAIFASFTLAACFAKPRSLLFLGGLLGSCVFLMTILSFANLFLHTRLVHDISVYGGLLVLIGFVLYDTQIALEELKRGTSDDVTQAVQFYTDFVGIFVRLLIIMLEKQQRDEENRRKNRRT